MPRLYVACIHGMYSGVRGTPGSGALLPKSRASGFRFFDWAHTGVTAEDLIAGYREIVARAHAAGKCVVGAAVGPFRGWPEWDPAAEAVRQEVNAFVRGGGEFDAVADFDRVLRSPYDPERMLPFLDNGDHIHPNDKGMQAMADAVDLDSLECARR